MKSKLRASQGMVDYFKKEQDSILESKQKEPNQDIIMELQKDPLLKDFDNQVNKKISFLKQKQETLEEAAETELYITINKIIDGGKDLPKGYNVTRGQAVDYAFEIALKVAKWQQERMYSEEDMKQAFLDGMFCSSGDTVENSIEEWFEKFKKK